jgi:hypothetical protein
LLSATIFIERGDPHEGSNLLAIEEAQLREHTQQGGRGHRTDAGNALEESIFLLPKGRALDELFNLLV